MKTKHQDTRLMKKTGPVKPKVLNDPLISEAIIDSHTIHLRSLRKKLQTHKHLNELAEKTAASQDELKNMVDFIFDLNPRVREAAAHVLYNVAGRADLTGFFPDFKRLLDADRCHEVERTLIEMICNLGCKHNVDVSELVPSVIINYKRGRYFHTDLIRGLVADLLRTHVEHGADMNEITLQLLSDAEAYGCNINIQNKGRALYLLGGYKWPEQYAQRSQQALLSALDEVIPEIRNRALYAWLIRATFGFDITVALPRLATYLHLGDEYAKYTAGQVVALAAQYGQDISIVLPDFVQLLGIQGIDTSKHLRFIVKGVQCAIINEKTRDSTMSALYDFIHSPVFKKAGTAENCYAPVCDILAFAVDHDIDILRFIPRVIEYKNIDSLSHTYAYNIFSKLVQKGRLEELARVYLDRISESNKDQKVIQIRSLVSIADCQDAQLNRLIVRVFRGILDSKWFGIECAENTKYYEKVVSIISATLQSLNQNWRLEDSSGENQSEPQ